MALFTDEYRRLQAEMASGVYDVDTKSLPVQQQINEEIVRCLWFGLHFDVDRLRLEDGRRFEPLIPGWWSVEPGPDFRRAELLVEGEGRVIGDVEVHVRSSEWYAHGHAANPAYDNVALHVVMWNDLPEKTVKTASGRAVPQFMLLPQVADQMPEILEMIGPDGHEAYAPPRGRHCAENRARLDKDWIIELLGIAGDARALVRAERDQRLLARGSREQVLYEGLMDALGYKNNRLAFQHLARLVPTRVIQETLPEHADEEVRAETLEAVLFGAAGLFPEGEKTSRMDGESRALVERLKARWDAERSRLAGQPMTAGHWRFQGSRPLNYPTRRIAGVARMLARLGGPTLFRHILRLIQSSPQSGGGPREARRLFRELTGLICDVQDPYWSARC